MEPKGPTHWGGWGHLLVIKCSVGLWNWDDKPDCAELMQWVLSAMFSESCLAGKWSAFVLALFWLPSLQTRQIGTALGKSSVRSEAEQDPHKAFSSSPKVSLGNGWIWIPKPWGLEQALVQVLTAPPINTGQSQTSPLVPFFGITSGKAAWLQGKDLREGIRMEADLIHRLRNISLCSLATLNNRNDPLLGKANCAFHERCPKTLDLKGKGSWGYWRSPHCPDFILNPVDGSCWPRSCSAAHMDSRR